MKRKAILALVLALALVFALFSACAKSGTEAASGSDSSTAANTSSGDNAGSDPDTEDTDAEAATDEEIAEIVMYIVDMNVTSATSDEHKQAIEDAINAITEPQIGVHVTFKTSQTAEYMTGMPLDIAGGETLDIVGVFPMAPINLTSLYSNNQLLDISPYLETEGQDILSVAGPYLDAVTIAGGIYMVPNIRNYASSEYMIWIADWIDELGYTDLVQNMTTWAEFEEVMNAIHDKYGVAAMAAQGSGEDTRVLLHGTGGITFSGTGDLNNALVTDNVGDNLYVVATDPDTNKAYNLYTDPHFAEGCETTKRWYDEGLIYADAAVTQDDVAVQVKNEVAAGYIVTSELGVEVAKESQCDHRMYATKLCDAMVTSGVVTRFGLAVAVNSEEPAAAVRFLNLLMTSKELNNLLDYGIEGEDWQMLDTGEAGLTENSQFHGMDFMLGNAFLAESWDGNGADYRERCREANDAAPISSYLGFSFDTSELANTVAAITSVQQEYLPGLTCGLYEEENYNTFLSKLESAGINDYIAEAQTQIGRAHV